MPLLFILIIRLAILIEVCYYVQSRNNDYQYTDNNTDKIKEHKVEKVFEIL